MQPSDAITPAPADIERYLHEHIPLSQKIGVSVAAADASGVRLCAPFLPNINHFNTAFGGSVSALAILAGWTLVYVRLCPLALHRQIVIQRNAVEYLKPIQQDFCAFCPSPPEQDWQRLIQMLTRYSRGRITLKADVFSDEVRVGTFEGDYVAIKS